MWFIDWLLDNKEWLFSGLGLVIVAVVIRSLLHRRLWEPVLSFLNKLIVYILVLAHVATAITSFYWKQKPLKGQIIICSAKWGVEGVNTKDVTNKVITRVSAEGHTMLVHNKLFCPNPKDDPTPGTEKDLQVVYLYGDSETVHENGTLKFKRRK